MPTPSAISKEDFVSEIPTETSKTFDSAEFTTTQLLPSPSTLSTSSSSPKLVAKSVLPSSTTTTQSTSSTSLKLVAFESSTSTTSTTLTDLSPSTTASSPTQTLPRSPTSTSGPSSSSSSPSPTPLTSPSPLIPTGNPKLSPSDPGLPFPLWSNSFSSKFAFFGQSFTFNNPIFGLPVELQDLKSSSRLFSFPNSKEGLRSTTGVAQRNSDGDESSASNPILVPESSPPIASKRIFDETDPKSPLISETASKPLFDESFRSKSSPDQSDSVTESESKLATGIGESSPSGPSSVDVSGSIAPQKSFDSRIPELLTKRYFMYDCSVDLLSWTVEIQLSCPVAINSRCFPFN